MIAFKKGNIKWENLSKNDTNKTNSELKHLEAKH